MPIIQSAKKALRQSKKKATFNRLVKDKAKEAIQIFKRKPSAENLKNVYSTLDKAVKKNIFHKNKVARLKGSLSELIKKTSKGVRQSSSKKKAAGKKKSSSKMSKKK